MKKLLIVFSFFLLQVLICQVANASPRISEIMANPEGKDEDKEWIELYNPTDRNIELINYSIAAENGKGFKFSININAKSHRVIKSKISLKNSTNSILLVDNKDQVIDKVSYEKPKEAKSYSHITIKNADSEKSFWANSEPSPGSKNPLFYELSGKISLAPTIAKDYYFEINDKQKISFDNEKFPFPKMSQSLTKGQEIELRASLSVKGYQLESYRLRSTPTQPHSEKKSGKLPALLILISILLLTQLFKKSPIKHIT
jgi:hypothetical protein